MTSKDLKNLIYKAEKQFDQEKSSNYIASNVTNKERKFITKNNKISNKSKLKDLNSDLLKGKEYSLVIHLCDEDSERFSQFKKEKDIDLEFKNELECLFSSKNENRVGFKKKLLSKRPKFDENLKLINLFQLIGGHLIRDNSELLVDYGSKVLFSNSANLSLISNKPSSSFSTESSFILSTDFDYSSIDDTLKLFCLMKNKNNLKKLFCDPIKFQNSKILSILIKLLVKSCSVFDCATMTNLNGDMAYWRYANPLAALCKRTKNAVTLRYLKKKSNKSVQTSLNYNEEIGTNKNLRFKNISDCIRKNINKKSFQINTIDIEDEGMNVNIEKDTNTKRKTNNDSASFLDYVNNLILFKEEEVKKNRLGLEINDILSEVDQNNNRKIRNKKYDKNLNSLDRANDNYHSSIKNNALGDSYLNRFFLSSNINTNSNTNLTTKTTSDYLNNTHPFNYNKNRLDRFIFNLRNANQDETLRDAENISDIENESYIDQTLNIEEEYDVKKNKKRASSQKVTQIKSSNCSFNSNKNINDNTSRSLSSNLEAFSIYSNVNSIDASTVTWSTSNSKELFKLNLNKYCLVEKYLKNKSKRIDKKYKKKKSNSLQKMMNCKIQDHPEHNRHIRAGEEDSRLRLERTHSLDSLEEEKEAMKYDVVTNINCGKFIIETQEANYDVDVDINVSRVDQNTNGRHEIECSRLSEIPEVKIDFEYKLKSSKSNLSLVQQEKKNLQLASCSSASNNSEDSNNSSPTFHNLNEETAIVKQRTRESLKFWKQEEQKERRKDSHSSVCMKQIKSNYSVIQKNSNSTKTSSSVSNQTGVIDNSNISENIPVKCVKDRINVFESKNSCQILTKVPNKNPEPPLVIPIDRNEHIKYRQRGKSLESNRLLIQSEDVNRKEQDKNELNISSSKPTPIICTSTLLTNKYLNVSLDNLSPKQIPIKYKDEYLSSTNHFETNLESENLSKNTILNLSEDDDESDMEEFEIIIDLSTLKSRRCYPNEQNNEIGEKNEKTDHAISSYCEDTDEEFRQVAESILNKSLDSFRVAAKDQRNTIDQLNQKVNKSGEELAECSLNLLEQEKIRSIVMYLIPTTRKAYVDDIVDGVKTMMPISELKKVNSPIDLPENIIKFIQKRYSNLLNDLNVSSSSSSSEFSSSNQPACETIEKETRKGENQEEFESLPVSLGTEPPTENLITTELTVVKEIRSNQSSHISSFSSMQELSPSENATIVATDNKTCSNTATTTNNNNTLKLGQINSNIVMNEVSDETLRVEEETLYIVEKRRPKIASQSNEKPVDSENSDIDLEIRKNFELKEKPISKKSLTTAKTLSSISSSSPSSSSSSSLNIHNQEHVVKTKITTFDCKELNQLDYEYELLRINLIQLVNDLRQSIIDFNNYNSFKADGTTQTSEINDYQLHYLKDKKVLVMLFDKKNSQNYKYALEKCYHKSIIDTHNLNNKQEINIIANLNVSYLESQIAQSTLVENKFEMFSLIKAGASNNLNFQSNLPIGKYFVSIKYESTVQTKLSKKESIVDLSLLPIALRAQLIFECEEFLNIKLETYKKTRLSNTSFNNIELPNINMLAIDSYLVQIEINKKRDQIIRESLVKTKNDTSMFSNNIVTSNFTEIIEFDTFMKTLEVDLNSYYICEKVVDLNESANLNEKSGYSEDLVKLNKLDALASFKCVQKYRKVNSLNDSKDHTENCFYLIDNGNHYRCIIPSEDLNSIDDSSVSVVKYPESEKNVIENIHKRQNFIFSKHLMSAFPSNEENNVKSLKLKQQLENDSGFNDLANTHDQAEKDIDLPSFSESVNEKNVVFMKKVKKDNQHKNSKTYGSSGSKCQMNQELKNNSNMETFDSFRDSDEFLKSNFKILEDYFQTKHLRDKVIVKEIDRMFRSIRDHQSSSVKAKYEDKKKNNGSWGYSSSKRHVKAKVMELPFAEDLDSLAKKIGIKDLNDIDYAFDEKDDAVERVFVRIDDFLNVEISQILQRSYSLDYLNELIGPRARISDVKIPTNQTTNNQSFLSSESFNINLNKNENNQIKSSNDTGQFREAPYDLKYWSILKLLEEERKYGDRQSKNYFEDVSKKVKENQNDFITDILNCGNLKTQSELSEDLEQFLSKKDLDKELEKIKNQNSFKKILTPSPSFSSLHHANNVNSIKPTKKALKDFPQNPNNLCVKTPTYKIKEKLKNNSYSLPNDTEIGKNQCTYNTKTHNDANRLVSEENLYDKNFSIIDEIINCAKQQNQSQVNTQSEFFTKSNSSIGTRSGSNQKHRENPASKTKHNIVEKKIIGCYDENFSFIDKKYSSSPTLLSNLNNLFAMPKTSMQFNIFDEKKSSKDK